MAAGWTGQGSGDEVTEVACLLSDKASLTDFPRVTRVEWGKATTQGKPRITQGPSERRLVNTSEAPSLRPLGRGEEASQER